MSNFLKKLAVSAVFGGLYVFGLYLVLQIFAPGFVAELAEELIGSFLLTIPFWWLSGMFAINVVKHSDITLFDRTNDPFTNLFQALIEEGLYSATGLLLVWIVSLFISFTVASWLSLWLAIYMVCWILKLTGSGYNYFSKLVEISSNSD